MTECIISVQCVAPALERCVEQRGNTKRNERWNRTEKFFVFLLRFYDFKLNSGAWNMLSLHKHQQRSSTVLVRCAESPHSRTHPDRNVWNGKNKVAVFCLLHSPKKKTVDIFGSSLQHGASTSSSSRRRNCVWKFFFCSLLWSSILIVAISLIIKFVT